MQDIEEQLRFTEEKLYLLEKRAEVGLDDLTPRPDL